MTSKNQKLKETGEPKIGALRKVMIRVLKGSGMDILDGYLKLLGRQNKKGQISGWRIGTGKGRGETK